MKDTLWLIRKTLITTFKNYMNILLYFILPVMGILLATLIHGGSGDVQLRLGIVNHDKGQVISQELSSEISRMDSMLVSESDQAAIDELITSGELDAAILIPAGFTQSLIDGQSKAVQIVSIKGAQVTTYVKAYINQYMSNVAAIGQLAAGDETLFQAKYAEFRQSDFNFTSEKLEDHSANHNMTKQSIGYLLILMMVSAMSLSGILIKERENRTYHRLLSSPINARAYVLSNVIVNVVMMMLQISVTLWIMINLFHVDPGIPYWSLFLVLVLFALVAISLSLTVVAFASSSSIANGLQNTLIIPTSLLAGCMFPLELMPEIMHRVAQFLPQYWLMDVVGKLQLNMSFTEVYLNLMILLAFAVVLTLLTVYKFGRSNDTRTYI